MYKTVLQKIFLKRTNRRRTNSGVQRGWERDNKSHCSNSLIEKKASMTPEDLNDYKKGSL